MKKHPLLIIFIFSLVCISSSSAQRVKNIQTKRFVYQTSLGYANGMLNINFNDNEQHIKNTLRTFRIQQQIGYQFNNYVSIGLGGGIDIWRKNAFIPLFANINVYMLDYKIAPYWHLNAGYAFKWYVSSKPDDVTRVRLATTPGPFGETGLGIKISITDRITLLVAADYLLFYSQIDYSVPVPGEADHSDITTNSFEKTFYHFAGVKLGLVY
ncbi:MAG: hypothetical protein LBU51_01715 [Bacteroidales bacterium]|jgi:hypothetical protein|nr:hypothetical protein [Bacteroidales bacterium]